VSRPLPLLVALLLAACAPDTVALRYGLQPGRDLQYELRLDARIERTLSGETQRQDVEATFRAGQEIQEALPGGGARARMTLVPSSLVVDGEPVAAGPAQEFLVELGPDGGVRAIEEAGPGAADALGPVGLERLLPRLRPVLPGIAAAPGETWQSRTEFADDRGTFSLASTSRLDRFGVTEGRDAALVRTTYVSPVDREEPLENAVAEIRGRDVGAQAAWFALDGFLVRSTGDSLGTYDVTFRPPPGESRLQPVEGSLVVQLHTEMTLVGAS
jgi:hypothetical protein